MSTHACFENIIGLSRRYCPCVDDRPIDAGISASGLYLDELPGLGLRMADSAKDCGDDGLWTMLDRARSNAILDFRADLGRAILQGTDARRRDGISTIGMEKNAHRTGHALNFNYHGLTIQTAKVKGGRFRVLAIGTAFKGTVPATIDVSVYARREEATEVLDTYTVNAQSGKIIWTDLPEPLELSMSELAVGHPRFWFLYEPPEGLQAMNCEISCGCGGFKPSWNERSPQYESSNQKNGMLWAEWAMAAGIRGNDLDARVEWGTCNPSQGLMLKVQFECDITSTFCPDTPNYEYDAVQQVMAHAVRFKAGADLITQLLNSTRIDRYTMTAGEALAATRDGYMTEYTNRVSGFLGPHFSEFNNINAYGDCRRCKDHHGMTRGLIRN